MKVSLCVKHFQQKHKDLILEPEYPYKNQVWLYSKRCGSEERLAGQSVQPKPKETQPV